MSRPPYFAFYPADFAGDINVEAMTTSQVGAYILLLCKAWQSDPPASLPNDDAVLARLARLTPAEWAEVKAGVLTPFTLGTDGRLHQKRLRQEHQKAMSLLKKRSKAGAAGAEARWQPHGNRIDVPMPPQRHTDGIQNQKKRETKTKAPLRGGGGFDPLAVELPHTGPAFRAAWEQWVAYRSSAGRKSVLTEHSVPMQLKFLAGLSEPDAVACIERSIRNTWAGLFPPDPDPKKSLFPTRGKAEMSHVADTVADTLRKRGMA